MLDAVISSVAKAGKKIIEVYETDDFSVEVKDDNSPLTRADRMAHDVLVEALEALNVGPVLSEEDAEISWQTRKTWTQYWLVDPLDGTKEFIKRNGEFTVNVALIKDGVPVLGVVYAPVLKLWYYGQQGLGAFRRRDGEEPIRITPSPVPSGGNPWRVVGSRSHGSEEFDAFMRNFENSQLVSIGSSLKLCMVADGGADVYPRLIPTCEWDTAAAQAVVEAAGGIVVDWQTHKSLRYNTKDSLLNPFFMVCASEEALAKVLSASGN